MKYQATLVLLVIALARAAYVCPRFQCAPATYELQLDEVCARKNASGTNTTFNLYMCASPNYQNCSFAFESTNSSCMNNSIPYRTLLPGDPCQYRESCKSDTCSAGYCVGKEVGAACASDVECRAGAYCNYMSKCEVLLPEGASCANTSTRGVCQNHLVCVYNNCTRIGSLEIGNMSNNPLACKSMYIKTDEVGIQRCAQGLANVGYTAGNLVECQMGYTCNYTEGGSSTVSFTSPCKCGVNAAGKGYCHPGEGNMQSDINIVSETEA